MKSWLVFFIIVISLLSNISKATPSEAILIEKIQKEEGKYTISYEKYKLSNGLTIIIHEDHSNPIVNVEVLYHVGSARDEIGRSGFAHFFEHMMFGGSEHVAAGEHIKIIHDAGGECNGRTTYDLTEYYETVPSNYLETALWLESDRMGFFVNAISPKKFEIEKSTVKNERDESIENIPFGLLSEKMSSALYSIDQPYSKPSIGWRDDIDKADFNELKRYFLRWYCPNNAVLVIAGDLNSTETIRLVEKYFGSINNGKAVHKLEPVKVKLDSSRFISYADNVRNPALDIAFPTVPVYDSDEVALDILADIFGREGTSMLSDKFIGVNNPIGVNIRAFHPCNEARGLFRITAILNQKAKVADAWELLRKTLSDFEKRGVKDDDLIECKANYIDKFFDRIETVKDRAFWLGYYECFYGNPNMSQSEYERYMKVNANDVKRVYEKYIKNKPCVVLSVYPKNKVKNVAQEDNYNIEQKENNIPESLDYADLYYIRPIDSFDRSAKPQPGPINLINTPDIWKYQFANGLILFGIQSENIPRVTVKISINAGHAYEPVNKAGIGALLGRVFNQSTSLHSGYYLATELRKLGSQITFVKNMDVLDIEIKSTKENLAKTFAILDEKMFSPKFDKYEFNWQKGRLADWINFIGKSPNAMANDVFMSKLYGKKCIYGTRLTGTIATVGNISRRDIKKYFKNNFCAGNTTVQVVGDLKAEDVLQKFKFFSYWKKGSHQHKRPIELPKIDKTRIYFVSKPYAPQSEIRIGCAALPFDPLGEQFKCSVMNYQLGGSASGRLNQKLRETNAYTYGVYSKFYASKYTGHFRVETSVKADKTDSAIMLIMNELKNYADNGITDSEFTNLKKTYFLKEALDYESLNEKSSYLWKLMYFNLDKDYLKQQQSILENMSKEEINDLAKKYLPYNNMVIVVVGDKSILPALKKLPYEIVEVNEN